MVDNYNPSSYWCCPDPGHVIQFMHKPAYPYCKARTFSHMECAACGRREPYMHKGLTVCCEQPVRKAYGECGKALEFHLGDSEDMNRIAELLKNRRSASG